MLPKYSLAILFSVLTFTSCRQTNEKVINRVKKALIKYPNITINVDHQIVDLYCDSIKQDDAIKAILIVSKVDGVETVHNNMNVLSEQKNNPIDTNNDSSIEKSLINKFDKFPNLSYKVQDGTVFISGLVKIDDWGKFYKTMLTIQAKKIDRSNVRLD